MQKLEPYYLEAFRKHAAEHPNDLNFIVELASVKKPSAGGNGFGVATCELLLLSSSSARK